MPKNFFHRPGVQVHPLHPLAAPMTKEEYIHQRPANVNSRGLLGGRSKLTRTCGIATWWLPDGRGASRACCAVLAKFVLRVHSNCYFPDSDQNSDIATPFRHWTQRPRFPTRQQYITWQSDDVFTLWPWPLTFWPWTFAVHRMSSGIVYSNYIPTWNEIKQFAAELQRFKD